MRGPITSLNVADRDAPAAGVCFPQDSALSSLYTIGHSSHAFEEFAALLTRHAIEVVVDVRSAPYSKFAPQFDRDLIQGELGKFGVKYLFLGGELGGRPGNSAYYDASGRVLYSKLTSDPVFIEGIERLERGIASFRVAIMCGEEDPAHCHRRLLVGRVMTERGHALQHIRGDGAINSDADVARDSRKTLVNEQPALFAELDEDQWRSTASVLPRRTPNSFSEH
jgi:uncharacterized protein (DUF488 family)